MQPISLNLIGRARVRTMLSLPPVAGPAKSAAKPEQLPPPFPKSTLSTPLDSLIESAVAISSTPRGWQLTPVLNELENPPEVIGAAGAIERLLFVTFTSAVPCS